MFRGGDSGSGRGRPHKLPGVVAPSKLKRRCGAEGCDVQVVGTELPQHYRARTDFKKLGQLRKLPIEVAEEELKGLDPHTAYMFRHKHSSLNLPRWDTHRPVPKPLPKLFQKKAFNTNPDLPDWSAGKHGSGGEWRRKSRSRNRCH